MSDKKTKPFAIWGDITEEKIKEAFNKRNSKIVKEPETERKDKLLQIRVSDDYYQQLKSSAEERGINVSSLVRNAILEYVPNTLTKNEKETLKKQTKLYVIARMLWGLANITPALKENYDYEVSWNLPEEETLLKMFDDDVFKSIKLQVLNLILSEFKLEQNTDEDIEKIMLELFKCYINKK